MSYKTTTSPAPLDQAFDIIRRAGPAKAREGIRVLVARDVDIAEGARLIVEPRPGLSVGVFRIDGSLRAIKNVCPHNGAPLCRGTLHASHEPGETREFHPGLVGRVLRCPWHGWEFDVVTGKALYDAKSRVATYPVEVDDGSVYVVL
ncbi:MAG: Rieske 2Fe-2S domain-containing protein [Capsulimonadaceae bacterium]|nr:Rieske 2Fe-2S domain-containing protein [Capsulimonadaceae bacterium]